LGEFDVLVGINLLREGLDVPEVSLVAILDADKEGFLRSERSLVQTIGRAARNSEGKVIMYADKMTDSMQRAIDETSRRRSIQEAYNVEHGIVPKTIIKEIRDLISISKVAEEVADYDVNSYEDLSKEEKELLLLKLEKEMKEAAKALDFEKAATLRDTILELKA
jgi:excinuclease ABC subunit B